MFADVSPKLIMIYKFVCLNFEIGAVQKCVFFVSLGSLNAAKFLNEYLLAKIGFDTAENEPSQKVGKI